MRIKNNRRQTNPPNETLESLPQSAELESLPEDPAPEPEVPAVWTQELLATYDFRGWDWRNLPYGLVKAARRSGPSTITGKTECTECKRAMWSCNPQLEDLCEEDEYMLLMRNADLRDERTKAQMLQHFNPFTDDTQPTTRAFWPKDET